MLICVKNQICLLHYFKENETLREKQIFINTYAPTIRKIINEYRSTAQENFKKEILKSKL